MKKKAIIVLIILIIFTSLTYLYARYIGTTGLRIKEYKINANVEDSYSGLKVIHFSDIHYKMTTNKKDLNNMVDKINFIKPDIVTFTGDLFDNELSLSEEDYSDLIDVLSKIDTKLGKYAIKGENDNEAFDEIMTKSGFIILNNNYELIYNKSNNPILIAGVSSNLIDKTDINEKLSSTYSYLIDNEIQYKILLMHEPDYIDKVSNFNLVLAGHSHKGNIDIAIFRNFLLKDGSKKYFSEYYYVNNTSLYISSGVGTDGLKLRLFNKPSINFYRIVKG